MRRYFSGPWRIPIDPALDYDTSLASERGYAILDDLLRREVETTLLWVCRPFAAAMASMIDRACADGRYLSLSRMVELHRASRRLLLEHAASLRNRFAGLTLRVIDNSGPSGGAEQMTLASLRANQSFLEEVEHAHAQHILAQAEAAGLPGDLARAIRGSG